MRAISLQPWSSPDHRTRAPGLALAALALGLLAAPTVTMGETIFACVKNDTGALRIVAKGTACRSGEYRLTWGTEGPQGPAGPAFPITCPADSVVVGTSCVDTYEASVWAILPTNTKLIRKVKDGTVTLADLEAAGAVQQGATGDDYTCNDDGNDCGPAPRPSRDDPDPRALYAVSVAGVTPSAYVTWFQAQQFCRMAGKRLVTNAEWQSAAAGTPDGAPCVVDASAPGPTGTAGCVSNAGAFDMVGNLSEWVADWIPPATDCQPDLFGTGDVNCMAIDPTGTVAVSRAGPAALIRGGFFAVGVLAGVFAVDGVHPLSNVVSGLGFRCAR